jgi:hypothetical protein
MNAGDFFFSAKIRLLNICAVVMVLIEEYDNNSRIDDSTIALLNY